MADTQPTVNHWVTGATYNASGQVTRISYGNSSTNEARTYNALQQLTRITMPGSTIDMQYVYPSTNNNGQITHAIGSISGERITYQYDALKRLSAALAHTTGSNPAPLWGQTFSYDGFGNLTDMTPTSGPAPALHQNVDATKNQVTGTGNSYDANGNTTTMVGTPTILYDVESHLRGYTGGEGYSYGPDHKRFMRSTGTSSVHEVALYGVGGELLATYSLDVNTNVVTNKETYYYFTGKSAVTQNPANYPVATDRLGSVRRSGTSPMRFYPYGQDFAGTPTANDQKKFGTYMRDHSCPKQELSKKQAPL